MRLEKFFEKFELFAAAPNAVPRMRRFILDLAVRGNLVAQDSKDESAVELLGQVQAEKARLVKSGEIKKQEQLPPVVEGAIPYLLPNGWTASQLGDVAVCLDYKREPINGTERDLRIAGKLQSELFPYYGATQQQGWIDDFIFDGELVLLGEDGVPFFDELRPKAYLISGKTWVNNHAHVFRGILVSNTYLMHWLNTFDYKGRVAGSTRSKLNQAKAVDIPIALPPLAEQIRIVAKVNDLMALCDRLEAQQQERDTRHAALARASLTHFAEAPTPANLDFLFHQSYPITPADLRKAIFILAVQGNLVPQDPNDEKSSEILAAIDRDAAQALRAKRMRKPKPIAAYENDLPFELPYGWEWSQLGRLTAAEDNAMCDGPFGSKLKTEHYVESRGYAVIRLGNIGVGKFIWGKEGYISRQHFELLSSNHIVPGDLIVAGLADPLVRCCEVPSELGPAVNKADCFRVRLSQRMNRTYIRHFLNSPIAKAFAAEENHGMTRERINLGNAKALPVPVPPLAEQHRIVAKVDQLMALVDQLETQLASSRAAAGKLMEAVVAELTTQRCPAHLHSATMKFGEHRAG